MGYISESISMEALFLTRYLEYSLDLEDRMGRKINLAHLSEDECRTILEVIQRDFKLRQGEEKRINELQNEINQEFGKSKILSKQKKFNHNFCMRCFSTFYFIFNRRIQCRQCNFNVCKECSEFDEKTKLWTCTTCLKQKIIKGQSCEWFYKQIKSRFRRFGSAKVIRSLYKRKLEAESDHSNSDSGYDQASSSPSSSMYGSHGTLLSEQVPTKDSSTNTSDSDSDSDPEIPGQGFHTISQELEMMMAQLQETDDVLIAIEKTSIGVQVPKDAVREVEGLVLDATDIYGRSHSRRRGKHHRRRPYRGEVAGIVGSIPSPIEELITPPIEALPKIDDAENTAATQTSEDKSTVQESPKKVRFRDAPVYVEPSSPEDEAHLSPIKEDIIMNSTSPSTLKATGYTDGDDRFQHGLKTGKESWPKTTESGEACILDDHPEAYDLSPESQEFLMEMNFKNKTRGLTEADGSRKSSQPEGMDLCQAAASKLENSRLDSMSSSYRLKGQKSDSVDTHCNSDSNHSNISTPATPPPSKASDSEETHSNGIFDNELELDLEPDLEHLSTSISSETVKSEGYYTPDMRSPESMSREGTMEYGLSTYQSKREFENHSSSASEHSTEDSNIEYLTPLSETEPFGICEIDGTQDNFLMRELNKKLDYSETCKEDKEEDAIKKVVQEVIESLVSYVVAVTDNVSMETVSESNDAGLNKMYVGCGKESVAYCTAGLESLPSFGDSAMSTNLNAERDLAEGGKEIHMDLPDVVRHEIPKEYMPEDIVRHHQFQTEQCAIVAYNDYVPQVQEKSFVGSGLPGSLPQVQGISHVDSDTDSDVSDHHEISLESTLDNVPVMHLDVHAGHLIHGESSDGEDLTTEDMRPPSYESAITGQHLKDIDEHPEMEYSERSGASVPVIEISEPRRSPVDPATLFELPDLSFPPDDIDSCHAKCDNESDGSSISRSPTLEMLELESRLTPADNTKPCDISSELVKQLSDGAAASTSKSERIEKELLTNGHAISDEALLFSPSDGPIGSQNAYDGVSNMADSFSLLHFDAESTATDSHEETSRLSQSEKCMSPRMKTANDDINSASSPVLCIFPTFSEVCKRSADDDTVSIPGVDTYKQTDNAVDDVGRDSHVEEHVIFSGLDPLLAHQEDFTEHVSDSDSVRSIASSSDGEDLFDDDISHELKDHFSTSEDDDDDLDDDVDIELQSVASVYEEALSRAAAMRERERTHRPTPPPSPKHSPKKKECLEIANLTMKVSLKQGEVLESAEHVLDSANHMRQLHSQVEELEAYITNLEKEVIGQDSLGDGCASDAETSQMKYRETSDESEVESDQQIKEGAKKSQEQLVEDVQALEEELLEATVDSAESEKSAATAVRMITDTVLKVITSTEKFITEEQQNDESGANSEDEEDRDEEPEPLAELYITESSNDSSPIKPADNSWMLTRLQVDEPDILFDESQSAKVHEEVATIEERVYMSAGRVFSLEEKIQILEGQVDQIDQNSPEHQITDLEDKVALAIAQVAQSEQQVLSIEDRIIALNHASQGAIGRKYNTQYSLDSSIPTARGAACSRSSMLLKGQSSNHGATHGLLQKPTSLDLPMRERSVFHRGRGSRPRQRGNVAARWNPAAPLQYSDCFGGASGGRVTSQNEPEEVKSGRTSVKQRAALFETQSSTESVKSERTVSGSSSSTCRQMEERDSNGSKSDQFQERPHKVLAM
ncbi:uncharacterized protein LOC102805016 [Saccoglossus kowalevskii]